MIRTSLHSKAVNSDLHARLADSTLYEESNKPRLKQLLSEQADIQKEINQTEESWLRKSEELQEMEQNLSIPDCQKDN